MQARFPHHVRAAGVANFASDAMAMEKDFRWLSASRPAPFGWQAEDLNRSGAIGDATQASPEKGEALLAHGAQAFCELLEDVARFDMDALSRGPKSG
jgi:creatinine amidohydrolase